VQNMDYWKYYDSESDTLYLEDPRLSQVGLPPGWRKEQDENEQWFVNDSTGDETEYDPRLTPDSFKSRGVELEVFDLV